MLVTCSQESQHVGSATKYLFGHVLGVVKPSINRGVAAPVYVGAALQDQA